MHVLRNKLERGQSAVTLRQWCDSGAVLWLWDSAVTRAVQWLGQYWDEPCCSLGQEPPPVFFPCGNIKAYRLTKSGIHVEERFSLEQILLS